MPVHTSRWMSLILSMNKSKNFVKRLTIFHVQLCSGAVGVWDRYGWSYTQLDSYSIVCTLFLLPFLCIIVMTEISCIVWKHFFFMEVHSLMYI